MTIAPLCFAPFSVTDMVYNSSCYTAPFLGVLKSIMRFYIGFNMMFIQILGLIIKLYWFPVLYGLCLGFIGYLLFKWLISEEPEEPLTQLESEIIRCIRLNASTGSTTQMMYEHMNNAFPDNPVRITDVKAALLQLKNKGYILSTQATLWLVSGN